jgi:altered-inheritance-of-mitochondria protein 5
VETVKSRWNAEIENAVRWAQTKDWDATREWAESLIFGSQPAERVREEVKQGFPTVRREATEIKEGGKSVLQEARAKSGEIGQAAKERAAVLADDSKAAISRGVEKSREVVNAGVEKGKEMAHKAAKEIGLAEKRLEHKVDEKFLRYSAVDRALAQRYENDGGQVMNKTVEEVLRERYQPIGQKSVGQAQDTDVVGFSGRDDV